MALRGFRATPKRLIGPFKQAQHHSKCAFTKAFEDAARFHSVRANMLQVSWLRAWICTCPHLCIYIYIYIYIDLLVRRRTNQLSGIERSGFEPGYFKELRSFFDWFFDSFLEPFGGLLERSLSRLEASWRGLEAQGGPRALQETSRRPKERSKRPQGGPKSAPGGLKTAPRALQEAPRALQEASRRLQEAPSRLQERSKRLQERFKSPSSPLQRL